MIMIWSNIFFVSKEIQAIQMDKLVVNLLMLWKTIFNNIQISSFDNKIQNIFKFM